MPFESVNRFSVLQPVTVPVTQSVLLDVRDRLFEVVQSPALLGDDQSGQTVSLTPDSTPELQFFFPGSTPATIQLEDKDANVFGPYTVTGTTATVGAALAGGRYTVIGQATNSDGDLVPIGGSITIVTDVYNDTYNEVYV